MSGRELDTETEIRRLKHERSVWRGVALGLAATLILLLAVGAVGALFLVRSSRAARAEEAARAEQAMQEAARQRDVAERARMLAEEAKKAKQP